MQENQYCLEAQAMDFTKVQHEEILMWHRRENYHQRLYPALYHDKKNVFWGQGLKYSKLELKTTTEPRRLVKYKIH